MIIDNDAKIWFNGHDVAVALGYTQPKDAISNNIENDDKIKLEDINTGIKVEKHPHSIYINESGLYSLLLSSRLKKAKKFKKWVTGDVIPSIRKYGFYKIKKQHEKEMSDVITKLNYMESEMKKVERDLKKDKYPEGATVYAINYSENGKEIYRIGKTGNMKARMQIYNTHMLHDKEISYYKDIKCPIKLETCVRAMLYDYRYKDNKDFYVCSLYKIKKAFNKCLKSIECVEQSGGGINKYFDIENLKKRIDKLQKKIDNAKNKIMDITEENMIEKKPKKVKKE